MSKRNPWRGGATGKVSTTAMVWDLETYERLQQDENVYQAVRFVDNNGNTSIMVFHNQHFEG